jgi:hypothetical protein
MTIRVGSDELTYSNPMPPLAVSAEVVNPDALMFVERTKAGSPPMEYIDHPPPLKLTPGLFVPPTLFINAPELP